MLELGKGAMLCSSTVCPAADDTEKVKATEEMADPAAQTKEEAGAIEEIAGLVGQDVEDDFPVDPAWLKSIGFTSRLVEAADMLHRPREAFRPGTLGSSHFRSLEAQGSSSANHVGIPPKGSGKTRHPLQPWSDNQTQWVPKKRARGKTDYQKGSVKPSNSESEDQSSTSESSWMACEAPHPVLGKLRSAWMACDAFLGQESPITGQAKQAYTSACQARRENEPLLRQLKASQLRASTIQTILDTMPRSRTKALDEINRLYTTRYEVVLNELDEARAEVDALEDLMGSSMTSQGKGSLAKQPETDSAPRCLRTEGGEFASSEVKVNMLLGGF